MKLEFTDEDLELIDSLTERYDPVKVLDKPDNINEAEWQTYLTPLRAELLIGIYAALVTKALFKARLVADDDPSAATVREMLRKSLFNFRSSFASRTNPRATSEDWQRR